MPSILTDEKIKEDCFDTRFPIAALNVLKPTGRGVPSIRAPPIPLYYPASIKSLGEGLAKTSGLPQAQVVNFIERKVRQEIAGLEEEKVEELPEVEIEVAEETKGDEEPIIRPLLQAQRSVDPTELGAEEFTEQRGVSGGRRGRPRGSRDSHPRVRRRQGDVAAEYVLEGILDDVQRQVEQREFDEL
tara:strand:+ start:133 stop:693 length:561 start_codon:yes stop_codon:yes gene_type:complete